METLARQIAWHNTFGLNVRYILEHDTSDNKALGILKEKIKEIDFNMTKSYGNMETSKVRPEHRKNFRREKALILTILREKECKKK